MPLPRAEEDRRGNAESEPRQGQPVQKAESPAVNTATKSESIDEVGISRKTAYDYEKLARDPEIVERVIADAEREGRVASRGYRLSAIADCLFTALEELSYWFFAFGSSKILSPRRSP